MIRCENLSFSFDQRSLFEALNMTIPSGQIVFVIGRSGAGKSILLKLMVGLLKPESGAVWLGDANLVPLEEEKLLSIRRQCGFVFQQPALLDIHTVFENISLGLDNAISPSERAAIVENCLSQVHLEKKWLVQYPKSLSFSTQKLVSIARAIALKPKYLFFDEPTTGMDPYTTSVIGQLIVDLTRDLSSTSVIVSHDIWVAMQCADRVILIDQGKVVADASPAELYQQEKKIVKDFLEEAKRRRKS